MLARTPHKVKCPPKLSSMALFEPGFPRKKICEDPGDLRNKLAFHLEMMCPDWPFPECSSEKIVHHFHSLALGGSFGK